MSFLVEDMHELFFIPKAFTKFNLFLVPDGPTCARIYEDFGGEGAYLTSGEGAVGDLRSFPLGHKRSGWSNAVSHVKVESGCRLVGYKQVNFQGEELQTWIAKDQTLEKDLHSKLG